MEECELSVNYLTHICHDVADLNATEWNILLATQANPTPFMRLDYLAALQSSQSAVPQTGWTAHYVTLRDGSALMAAAVLYVKSHSYGEYVFDWAWANAYQQHGVPYYPKGLVAVPFTPVPGARLLARNALARAQLLRTLIALCKENGLSSLHMLFTSEEDQTAALQAGMMLRHTVQFHWQNTPTGYAKFDDFLGTLSQDKRKKIRQERRKVSAAGVVFRAETGPAITAADWDFFYACYARTYREHGNAPYLTRDFFEKMATTMPENWLLFVAEREGEPIASSLIGLSDPKAPVKVAYGRYWGALQRVDCLHFEACYYRPLEWCIANGYQRFEGGAQGEHKMARALMPVKTSSAHWIAHPQFATAVGHFLEREDSGVSEYLEDLNAHSPFRQ